MDNKKVPSPRALAVRADLANRRFEAMPDLKLVGDRILQILTSVRRAKRTFTAEARRRGITLDQLTAAAIAGMLAEELHQGRRGPPRPAK
jgi:hypothetical protein